MKSFLLVPLFISAKMLEMCSIENLVCTDESVSDDLLKVESRANLGQDCRLFGY